MMKSLFYNTATSHRDVDIVTWKERLRGWWKTAVGINRRLLMWADSCRESRHQSKFSETKSPGHHKYPQSPHSDTVICKTEKKGWGRSLIFTFRHITSYSRAHVNVMNISPGRWRRQSASPPHRGRGSWCPAPLLTAWRHPPPQLHWTPWSPCGLHTEAYWSPLPSSGRQMCKKCGKRQSLTVNYFLLTVDRRFF